MCRGESLKYEMLDEERAELEHNYAARVAAEQSANAAAMAALEAKYRAKIGAEEARHAALSADMAAAEQLWDRENARLTAAQEQAAARLVAGCEARLLEERTLGRRLLADTAVLEVRRDPPLS